MLAFLATQFGPYPWKAGGGIVDGVEGLGFALETQTRPIYSKTFFEQPGSGDYGVLHENAHQWYGDSLALERWRDIWLNEGFATYAEWLWSEHEGQGTPQEIFDSWNGIPDDDPFWSLTIGDPGPGMEFDFAVYARGAMTLQALRQEVGDDDFFTIMRRWARTRAGGNVHDGRVHLARRARLRQGPRRPLRRVAVHPVEAGRGRGPGPALGRGLGRRPAPRATGGAEPAPALRPGRAGSPGALTRHGRAAEARHLAATSGRTPLAGAGGGHDPPGVGRCARAGQAPARVPTKVRLTGGVLDG